MHSIIGDGELGNAALQAEYFEIIHRTEDGKSITVGIPEVGIIHQVLERLEQCFGLIPPALLLERVFQLTDEVLEANRVLLTLGETAVGGLIK